MVSFAISRPFGPRDESARRVTGRRPCRDRLYTTQVALQALGDWENIACGPARGRGWHAGFYKRPASERKLRRFSVGVCCCVYEIDLQNKVFTHFLVGAIIL